ncbi:LysR family transcriptional regulator [Bradyrhizobium prioriisuperbiae]|uniref:LysR family transcriptional regulator n=1 Tax=Bradyrhizobium prioriisuperbiae TaxID=2854389 RepID=UPI0028E24D65|nr:LysR family transcriptional regulator [Bradyrhizobium prioritasuperba]
MSEINLGPRDIEAFLAVAAHGSFHAAAISLGISQPAVSSRVRHAEDVLGVKLFHRTTRKVWITEHGERLRIRSEQAMAELRAVIHEFRDEARMQRGRVVIGVAPTVAAGTVFIPIIEKFRRRWPGIEVIVRDDLVGRSLDRLVSGEIDFSLGPMTKADDRFEFEPLVLEQFVLVAHANHPLFRSRTVQLAEAAKYPLLTMPTETAAWEMLREAYEAEGAIFKPAFQSHNVITIVAMLKAEFGISYLPVGVLPLFETCDLKTAGVAPKPLMRSIAIATARGRSVQPGSAALMAALRVGFGAGRSRRTAARRTLRPPAQEV